jgi:hypothetical protein
MHDVHVCMFNPCYISITLCSTLNTREQQVRWTCCRIKPEPSIDLGSNRPEQSSSLHIDFRTQYSPRMYQVVAVTIVSSIVQTSEIDVDTHKNIGSHYSTVPLKRRYQGS